MDLVIREFSTLMRQFQRGNQIAATLRVHISSWNTQTEKPVYEFAAYPTFAMHTRQAG
jgi:hypothetical protein